jgi:hypothetical protein
MSQRANNRMQEILKEDPDYLSKTNTRSFLGKKHTEESKTKIGRKNSKYQTGSGNSQFGTMWITNNIENKKIKKHDLIPEGWRKGRIMFETNIAG